MTIFLKKKLDYSFSSIFKIAVMSANLLKIDNINDLNIYMVYDSFVLFKLEKDFIENGVRFEWIEEGDKIIGIIAKTSKKYNYQTLDEYQKFRNIIDLKNTYKYKELSKENV